MIDNVVDELQDINIGTYKAVPAHNKSIDDAVRIPHPWKYNYYEGVRPSI